MAPDSGLVQRLVENPTSHQEKALFYLQNISQFGMMIISSTSQIDLYTTSRNALEEVVSKIRYCH